jgi:predicted AAA+ superfamily ATPase
MREEILFEWNPWWSDDFELDAVEREKKSEVEKWLDRPEVIGLTGVRRSGKTTLMHMVIEDLLEDVDEENILFVKCDDERVDEENIIEEARSTYRELFDPEGRTYLFLDEVQSQENWSRTVKRIYDLEKDEKVFVTGSRVLKKELSDALAGRFARFDIYPFSFREFLEAKNQGIEDRKDAIMKADKLKHLLREFVEWGGFPEIVLEQDDELKKELLKFYSDTILYRDVVERSDVQNTNAVEKLKNYSLANVSNLANYSKIAGNLDVSDDTISKYLKAMEEAYFVFSMPIFAYSVKKQHRNPKKLYCIDTGIRNAAGFRFSEDIGRLYENAVFIHLKRQGRDPYYWKSGKGREIDFVIQEEQQIQQIIQVSYDFEDAEERELQGMKKGVEELEPEKATIVTDDSRENIEYEGTEVEVIPLREWLLPGQD